MTNPTHQLPIETVAAYMRNDSIAAHTRNHAIATVKRLLSDGTLDDAELGLAPTPGPASPPAADAQGNGLPKWFIVPGEPITVRDLVAKTKAGLKPSTRRAYGCYLDLLAEGYDKDGLTYPGIGDMLAHEVLPSPTVGEIEPRPSLTTRLPHRGPRPAQSLDPAALAALRRTVGFGDAGAQSVSPGDGESRGSAPANPPRARGPVQVSRSGRFGHEA